MSDGVALQGKSRARYGSSRSRFSSSSMHLFARSSSSFGFWFSAFAAFGGVTRVLVRRTFSACFVVEEEARGLALLGRPSCSNALARDIGVVEVVEKDAMVFWEVVGESRRENILKGGEKGGEWREEEGMGRAEEDEG